MTVNVHDFEKMETGDKREVYVRRYALRAYHVIVVEPTVDDHPQPLWAELAAVHVDDDDALRCAGGKGEEELEKHIAEVQTHWPENGGDGDNQVQERWLALEMFDRGVKAPLGDWSGKRADALLKKAKHRSALIENNPRQYRKYTLEARCNAMGANALEMMRGHLNGYVLTRDDAKAVLAATKVLEKISPRHGRLYFYLQHTGVKGNLNTVLGQIVAGLPMEVREVKRAE